MPDSSAPHAPGSRAIKIPLHTGNHADYSAPNRRRRSERYLQNAERAEASDAGPSSLGSGSDQDSPWSYSPIPTRPQHLLRNIAPSPGEGVRLPGSLHSKDEASTSQQKDKHKAGMPPPSSMPMLFNASSSPLGPSMLSSSSYKSINLNAHHDDPDEPPRLITYTKYSQGFTWNDELFLPSYMLGRYGERGRKKLYDGDFGDEDHCPVAEIFVTDEEAEAMMP
ncbi:uncharacterized protein PV07_08178 [Cladophialophora immunda]|uniref:Uncharacterized protein n=1 Tax=Cladophialophora immunda TaxID=569365 RepID=A0A0D2CY83_9EURO|nr:uncharacterized protein PV07_08178 [Cladophialophora immunda]KIW28519.1 hypothetical protein PV07_08178 [Cladophialophora immunda]OQU95123.1 hypothetical protein CLAIMM_01372 [Cladophialophora immunda]